MKRKSFFHNKMLQFRYEHKNFDNTFSRLRKSAEEVNKTLNKLSEIELTAQRIMEDCDRQKQQLSEEAEQKCKNYDRQLESRTAEQIRRIRQQLEEEKDSRLAQLRADTDATFSSLDAHYEQQHSQLSRELFEKILTM